MLQDGPIDSLLSTCHASSTCLQCPTNSMTLRAANPCSSRCPTLSAPVKDHRLLNPHSRLSIDCSSCPRANVAAVSCETHVLRFLRFLGHVRHPIRSSWPSQPLPAPTLDNHSRFLCRLVAFRLTSPPSPMLTCEALCHKIRPVLTPASAPPKPFCAWPHLSCLPCESPASVAVRPTAATACPH